MATPEYMRELIKRKPLLSDRTSPIVRSNKPISSSEGLKKIEFMNSKSDRIYRNFQFPQGVPMNYPLPQKSPVDSHSKVNPAYPPMIILPRKLIDVMADSAKKKLLPQSTASPAAMSQLTTSPAALASPAASLSARSPAFQPYAASLTCKPTASPSCQVQVSNSPHGSPQSSPAAQLFKISLEKDDRLNLIAEYACGEFHELQPAFMRLHNSFMEFASKKGIEFYRSVKDRIEQNIDIAWHADMWSKKLANPAASPVLLLDAKNSWNCLLVCEMKDLTQFLALLKNLRDAIGKTLSTMDSKLVKKMK